jgi:hypothetical protein
MTYWFKPHRYGIGATPANRKGWLVTVGFMLIVAAFLADLLTRDNLSVELILAWAAAFIAVELLFIWIAWKKTGGAWRRRWGSDDIGK